MSQRPSINATDHGAYARRTPPPHPPLSMDPIRIFQAPSTARRPHTRPLRPVKHRNRPMARLQFKGARCKTRNRKPCAGHCRAPQRRAIIPRWRGETGRASSPKRAGSPGQAPSSGRTGAPRHLRGQRRRAQAPNSARRAAGSIPTTHGGARWAQGARSTTSSTGPGPPATRRRRDPETPYLKIGDLRTHRFWAGPPHTPKFAGILIHNPGPPGTIRDPQAPTDRICHGERTTTSERRHDGSDFCQQPADSCLDR